MSEMAVTFLLLFLEAALVGGLLLIQPFVVRRGLLFGVYVGEDRWDGEEARGIRRRWMTGMVVAIAAGVGLGLLAVALRLGPPPIGFLVSTLVLIAASYGVYLRAYFQAKALAAPGTLPGAAAFVPDPPHGLVLPITSLVVALGAGLTAFAYAWLHYAQMPATVPTHFGPSGAPDAWSPRSIRSVMLLPFGALAIPAVLAVTACLSARAKRAIRLSDRGVSLEAQLRFRSATASFLSGVAILVALMMCGMSVAAVRTALGLAHGIPVWMMALAIVLVAYAIGGSLYIALRYGQGGARLERQAAGAPLTNGVADNSHWYLGGFYVNRDDPSWFVEKRFGLGYTINFGNPWAVGLLLVFLAVVATIVVSGLLTPQTTTPPIR